MTLTLSTVMLAGAIVAAVLFLIGLLFGLITAEGYKGKRYCNECMRRLSRNGFSVDGKDYEVASRIVRGARMLGGAR